MRVATRGPKTFVVRPAAGRRKQNPELKVPESDEIFG